MTRHSLQRFTLSEFPIQDKTVFLRVDYNVPLQQGRILNTYKIVQSIKTLEFLLEKNCKIIVATHLGRPEGKANPTLSTRIFQQELQPFFPKIKIVPLTDCIDPEIRQAIHSGTQKGIFILENLRFHPEEEENDSGFARKLAALAEVYVNDAFGAAHRAHASVSAITRYLPSVSGPLMEKEIAALNKIHLPVRPSVWLIGGAKLDKIGLLRRALRQADTILIGGALAFSFLRVQGYNIGVSRIDAESVQVAREILRQRNATKIILPIDVVTATRFSPRAPSMITPVDAMQTSQMGLDIGPKTLYLFKQELRRAKTIFWNGPLGYYEWAAFAEGTREIGRFLGTLTATTICGGGETVEALCKYHLQDRITHLSTGGGATIQYLSGGRLPALDALQENYKRLRRKY